MRWQIQNTTETESVLPLKSQKILFLSMISRRVIHLSDKIKAKYTSNESISDTFNIKRRIVVETSDAKSE